MCMLVSSYKHDCIFRVLLFHPKLGFNHRFHRNRIPEHSCPIELNCVLCMKRHIHWYIKIVCPLCQVAANREYIIISLYTIIIVIYMYFIKDCILIIAKTNYDIFILFDEQLALCILYRGADNICLWPSTAIGMVPIYKWTCN